VFLLFVALIATRAGDAGAVVFEAGPDSAPPRSIQDAIEAALAAGGDNEVRVQGGPYANVPPIEVPSTFAAGTLRITGGWDSSFTTQSLATLSIVDGDGTGSVFDLESTGGTVILEDFEIAGGITPNEGGGISVSLSGSGRAEVRHCALQGNQARNGGGIYATASDTSQLMVEDSLIAYNSATSPTSTAGGAGVQIDAYDAATFTIRGNDIANNMASAPMNQATGAGLYVSWCDTSGGEISDNLVRDNEIVGMGAQVGSSGALWQCSDTATGTVEVRRNRWLGGIGSFARQLSLISAGSGTLLFRDSIVAGGTASGIGADARDTSVLRLTNLTVADHVGTGVIGSVAAGATASLYNSIVFGNGDDTAPDDFDPGNNLIGIDPLFAGSGDFTPGAPAIDQGDSTPPGGLGGTDVFGAPRISGAAVDIGAIEVPEPGAAALAAAALVALWFRRVGARPDR
jgi:hypothetical protein